MSPLKNNAEKLRAPKICETFSEASILDYRKIKAKKVLGLPLNKEEEEAYAALFAKETLFKKG